MKNCEPFFEEKERNTVQKEILCMHQGSTCTAEFPTLSQTLVLSTSTSIPVLDQLLVESLN